MSVSKAGRFCESPKQFRPLVGIAGFKWQKDFYDHVIKSNEDVAVQVKYILDNPVRKGMVVSWEEHAFKGSIGCKLEDVLYRIV